MEDSPEGPETVREALTASALKEVLQHYGEALRARRKGIDKLNVYPVPDGDTGTNMSLTVQSVVAELKNAAAEDMHTVSTAISKGAIMGARGNSGAILAQALRGVAESVKEKSSIGPHDVAEALERARASAYESVLKPVEGTILTVLTAAADAAKKSADLGHSLKEQMVHVRHASADALARTPDLLPVLKQAGVVDAGGSGFLLFVDALRYVVSGVPIPGITDAMAGDDHGPDLSEAHSEISDLRYEVMFLLDAEDSKIGAFREAWSHLGDSIVVVGGDGLWNCHIHSDEIGPVVETAIAFGRPHQIRVTDLQEQTAAEHGEAWLGGASPDDAPAHHDPVETAVVAVVNGPGLSRIYRSLGAQQLVVGGQSMNPSVAELLNAVEAAPSSAVVILPNNKNIISAANQVNDLTEKTVCVIPTRSCVQGMSALIAYEDFKAIGENEVAMNACAQNVLYGEVTQAVRDSDSPAGPIKEGDWLGVSGGIAVVAGSLIDALCGLAETLVGDDHEVLTLIAGEGSDDEAAAALSAWLQEHRPNVEVEAHDGGQPLYPYLIGVE